MEYSPTYLIQKSLSYTDPLRMGRSPTGWGYGTARAIRDFPVVSPGWATAVTATVGLATLGAGLPLLAGGWALSAAYATGREAYSAAPGFVRFLGRLGERRPEFTAPMVDTRAAMNMRQASLRAIHDSGYMLRSVLGKEARLLHR